MMDIETNTVIFLRDVLATQTAFDPDVTAFLSCWNFEELWHGEAFSRLLGEAGVPRPARSRTGATASLRIRRRRARTEWIRRRVGANGYLSHMGTLLGIRDRVPGLRGDPHDLGRRERADHPDRATTA